MKLRQLHEDGHSVIGGIISFVGGVIVTILALRLVFRAIGANPTNGFVDWIYNASQPFDKPFLGLFHHSTVNLSTGSFELETLLAIVVYGVATSLLVNLFSGHRR